jgi:predicted nucleic acid-binding protein
MTSERGILDTNIVILLERLDARHLPGVPDITTITLAELAVGPLAASDDDERRRRERHVDDARRLFPYPLPFDAAAADAFATVAANLRSRGRKARARAFDAMIAAIALASGLPLYTTNPSDFTAIDGLAVVEVPSP